MFESDCRTRGSDALSDDSRVLCDLTRRYEIQLSIPRAPPSVISPVLRFNSNPMVPFGSIWPGLVYSVVFHAHHHDERFRLLP